MSNEKLITAEMFLPDVVTQYPGTRQVLDRYGLKGCGGPRGPHEQVSWFANLHGVPLDQLVRELNEVARTRVGSIPFHSSIADTIYRPFFIAGIITVLTLGCTWGAINLLTIGLKQNFAGISYSWTLAHGHAMVFGFVGFFIMGFAYQAFPRFKHSTLWRPRLAFSALPLMMTGIVVQTVAHLLWPPSFRLELIASTLQLIAIVVFAVALTMTARHARKPENYDRFVYSALAWFLVAAILNPVIFRLFELPATRDDRLFNLATFNIPYRDIQLIGIALIMILGVSLRFLHHAYGFREPTKNWRSFLFWGLNGSLVVGTALFICGMLSGNHWLLSLQWLTTFALLVIAIGTPWQFRLFRTVPPNEQDRGLKFIRAAHIWFILAAAMLVFTPIYNFVVYMPLTGSRIPFSHAFFGAYRHSLTVGFIMMMIVGVSSKVVPTLSGVNVRRANALWPTFLLLNIGNLTRVTSQIATDFFPSAYTAMGFSGFIEVVGLTLWGYEMVSNMRAGKRLEGQPLLSEAHHTQLITGQTLVGDVLARNPHSLQIFLKYGFGPLANPILRRTMARVVTLEQACRREGVELEGLLAELNQSAVNLGRASSVQTVSLTRIAPSN